MSDRNEVDALVEHIGKKMLIILVVAVIFLFIAAGGYLFLKGLGLFLSLAFFIASVFGILGAGA